MEDNNSINQERFTVTIKVYGKTDLCEIYGVSRDTFNKWLKAIEHLLPHYNRNAKTLTPAQVRVIFEALGLPDEKGIERKKSGKKAKVET